MRLRLTTTTLAIGLATLLFQPLTAHGRVWTSAADKSRTFEATFVKCENDIVTVRMKSGTPLSFPLATVSEADRAYVQQRIGKATPVPDAASAPALDLPELFAGKLVTVDADGKVQPFAYPKENTPRYFVLYVSAYW